jgi:spore coat protein A
MLTRRKFLKLSGAALPALGTRRGTAFEQTAKTAGASSTQPKYIHNITPYIDPLPILHQLKPVKTGKRVLQYRIRITEFQQRLHSQLPPTKLWGYESSYPGPVIEAWKGQPISIRWENNLPQQPIFCADPHLHGAMPAAPPVRIVTHVHGARSRSEDDGLPENWFTPGHHKTSQYSNNQQAATLWYHDHALGITRLNVYAGLSGFFLLRDERERSLELPEGMYEIPLIIQDRTLDDQGQLVYSPSQEDGSQSPPGVWGPEFFGDLPVVNGAVYPHLNVEPRAYRLRVLNGANSRFFNLFFNLAKTSEEIPSLMSFYQIGSDGGLLPEAVKLEKLLLAPAERADLIMDFSELQGEIVTLSNDAPTPFPGWQLLERFGANLPYLLQIRVCLPLSGQRSSFTVPSLFPITAVPEKDAVRTRDLILYEYMDTRGRSLGVKINGKGYEEPVTETVKLGSIEKWRFINTTDDAHPMHLHLVQFQILERQGFDIAAFRAGTVKLSGNTRKPAPNEAGWKDTVRVNPNEIVTIIARFEGYTGKYLYHCHMLEHEDNDMMRPYEVID